jgi:hypothetical protein
MAVEPPIKAVNAVNIAVNTGKNMNDNERK